MNSSFDIFSAVMIPTGQGFFRAGGGVWAGSDVYDLPFLGMVLPSVFRQWASDLWLVSG